MVHVLRRSRRQPCCARNSSAAALNLGSPVARMWLRLGMMKASPCGSSSASAVADRRPCRRPRRPRPAPAGSIRRTSASGIGSRDVIMQAASAAPVGLRVIGKNAELAAGCAFHLRQRLRRQRGDDLLGILEPGDEVDPHAAPDGAAHPLADGAAPEGGDPRAHRIAHHRHALDAQMIEQPRRVVGHVVGEIELRIVELARFAVAAIVDGDRLRSRPCCSVSTQPVLTQLIMPDEAKPWISRIGAALAIDFIGDVDAVGRESWA